ncbi:YheC/YheD family protein [Marinithermofilum abyssi]|uniref:YheC/YheD family protein n=1 Tax=Marinithermofilum abyssi TaxID=1571185 RepID=UPI001664330B|nr:YheC/YheD family protein [Marinithermofilum abyssi]
MRTLRYVRSKWTQANLLTRHSPTAAHVPATLPFSAANMKRLLSRYSTLYVKPDAGGQGIGVIRVDRRKGRGYLVRTAGKRMVSKDSKALFRVLRKSTKHRRYVIQQGIPSVTLKGNPFAIRVHIQRVQGKWVIGGVAGTVAPPRKIVTNRHRGGTPMEMNVLLKRHLGYNKNQRSNMKQQLEKLSREAARAMAKGYPRIREYGIDFGLNSNGKLWIYEVNITPGIAIFASLPNKGQYYRILRLRKR